MSTNTVPMGPREEPNRLAQDFLVTAAGLATSLITAAILVAAALQFDFALYSFTLWFVIPAGAICCGFAAASGYYFGSRAFDHRPTKLLLVNAAVVSTATFFLIHYLTYYFVTLDGKAIRESLAFSDYFRFELANTYVRIGSSGESALPLPDAWSYAYAAIQIIGFAIGGVAVYYFLKALPYCERCSKYFAAKEKKTKYSSDGVALAKITMQVRDTARAGRLDEALAIFAHAGEDRSSAKTTTQRAQMQIKDCKGCGRHHVKYTISHLVSREWKDVPGAGFQLFTDGPAVQGP